MSSLVEDRDLQLVVAEDRDAVGAMADAQSRRLRSTKDEMHFSPRGDLHGRATHLEDHRDRMLGGLEDNHPTWLPADGLHDAETKAG